MKTLLLLHNFFENIKGRRGGEGGWGEEGEREQRGKREERGRNEKVIEKRGSSNIKKAYLPIKIYSDYGTSISPSPYLCQQRGSLEHHIYLS